MEVKTKVVNQLLDKEKCILLLAREGYFVCSEDDFSLVMKKNGTQLTVNGESFPKELTINFGNNSSKISLKYDGFVLFDTGDLEQELDGLSERILENAVR